MKSMKTMRWHKVLAPSAQMFRGMNKGMGRGRGPLLSEVPVRTDAGSEKARRDGLVSA